MSFKIRHWVLSLYIALACFLGSAAIAQLPGAKEAKHFPWSDATLSADVRADMVIKQMTLDEKISLLHGQGMPIGPQTRNEGNGGAGYTIAIPRLGIPSIQMADSEYGVTRGAAMGRYATALPNNLGAASSWDTNAMEEYGALIGRELRDQGYSMSLGGGTNLAREPRNGRTFEYMGEDPLLAGTLDGNVEKGVQSQHIIGDLKHYAVNDQESGRMAVNANIDKRSLRETDLRAFEIALSISNAGAAMCSYNRVNGDYACENKYLLNDVLKGAFHFPGFVLSDWGGTHSTVLASHAGLDQEEPGDYFYGAALKKAIEDAQISEAELNEHVHRILRTIFAVGCFDDPIKMQVPDVERGLATAQHIAEESIILLKNENNVLPLEGVHRIAVIGGHADVAVLSGGGSAQVDPPGGTPIPPPPPGNGIFAAFIREAWIPSSPLRALKAAMPAVNISFTPGNDLDAAQRAAKEADVAIVFAYQWEAESFDLPTLDLVPEQNKLIESVASSNPKTIVVLETGSPATMPWADKVKGIVEAWYPGIRGGEALAEILTGKVNPSAKFAITFPKSDADLPHPKIVMPPASSEPNFSATGEGSVDFMKVLGQGLPAFQTHYDEGLKVGYKWYDAEKKPVLFTFGFGLSYTSFAYSGLTVSGAEALSVSFTVQNTGKRAGTEIAQVYASLPKAAGEPPKRLIGWSRIELSPGESKQVAIPVERDRLSIYEESSDRWRLVPGQYTIFVGGSSRELPLNKSLELR
jgi:beta-glucosidase